MTTADTRRASHSSTEGLDSESTVSQPVDKGTRFLTPRESEILALLSQGMSNKIIAHELEISESSVKVFVRRILTKLQVSNRTEVAALVRRHGGTVGVGNRSEAEKRSRPSSDAIEAFESVVLELADEEEGESAVETLLELIRREADVLRTSTTDELEEIRQSSARIEGLLNEAVHYQASTNEWLNRLP